MAFPTVAVNVSLTTSRFATPSYTNLAADAHSVDIKVGRQSELEDANPGEAAVDFDSSARKYDPNNTAGTYYPNLTPGKKVQIRARYDATGGATLITYVGIGALSSGNNASLTPALPGGWVAGDLLLILASIRNSGTGTVNVPSGWTALLTSGNVSLLGRIAQAADVAPTVTFAGGVANATTLAQCWAFRGTEQDITQVLSASTAQLNASAQNIAVPGLTVAEANNAVVVMGWKQDDWTSVAPLSGQGLTEISDSTTTTGDDASHVIDYKIETTAANLTTTTLTVTGGAAAISRALVVAIRPFSGTYYELFNGWTDGWANEFARRSGRAHMRASGPFKFLARTVIPDPYSEAVMADGPVAWYRLNETAGKVLKDSSGNDLHGRWTPELADVSTTSGLVVSNDQAVTLPSDPAWAVGTIPKEAVPTLRPLSIEFWLKLDKVPKQLTTPMWLSAEEFSAIVFGGGINVRVWAEGTAYPGAVDFIVGDRPNLATTDLAIATTAFDYWYYNICDGRPHHVVATINSAANFLSIWVDGVDRAPYNNFSGTIDAALPAFGNIELNPGGGWQGSAVVDELAFYDFELSEAEVLAHYEAGAVPWVGDGTGDRIGRVLDLIDWPADLRDLDTGSTILGVVDAAGQKALPHFDVLATTEQGWLSEAHADTGKVRFQGRSERLTDARSATAQTFFSDSDIHIAFNSAVTYSAIELANDDRPAANIVTIKWRGGEVTTRSQSSVDAYGDIPVSLETILETDEEAANLAEWVLAEQASLFTRVRSITLRPSEMISTARDRAYAAALGRQEGDRVRVVHTPASSGAAIDQQLWIIGIEHHVGSYSWETTLHFAPAITTAYWLLGTGALDSTTRLSY